MAVKKKRNNTTKPSGGENYFTVSIEKKKKILGLFLVVAAVLLLISILSYSRKDQALLNYQISNLIDNGGKVHNWLGIAGAYISNFFINSTVGIFSALIPIIIFAWGLNFFQKIKYRTLIHTSNFLLILTIIFSSFFGLLYARYDLFSTSYELYGSIGDYLGDLIGKLIGGVGGIVFLFASLVALLIIAFDIKIEKIFEFLKKAFSTSVGSIKEELEKSNAESENDSNLNKIKELGKEKKKKKKLDKKKDAEVSAEELMQAEAEDQTKIRIIRKDDGTSSKKEEENLVLNEEVKKVDLEKTGEINTKDIDRDMELNLPNNWEEKIEFKKLSLELLDLAPEENIKVAEEELTRNAELLKEKLKLFDIAIQDISVTPGPVVTLYEIVPEPGVKISKIVGLENDIALALAARGIRIIAPIPGKSAIGVEIPNAEASLVNARSVLGKISESKFELPLALGKTINGDVYITDLTKMPHMLIAGSTGSGKSVGINMIIASMLYTKHPSEVKLIMIDPKKIELSFYNKLRRHYLAVSPDLEEEIITNPQNAVLLLKSVEYEMEKRYDKLAKAGVRNLVDYNKKVTDPKKKPADTETMKHHFSTLPCSNN